MVRVHTVAVAVVVVDLFCMLFLIAAALECVCVWQNDMHFAIPLNRHLPLFALKRFQFWFNYVCNLSENHAICVISLRKKNPNQTRSDQFVCTKKKKWVCKKYSENWRHAMNADAQSVKRCDGHFKCPHNSPFDILIDPYM